MMAAVSHFTDIGFALDTADEAGFEKSLVALTRNCTPQPLGEQDQVCLIKDASGAELRVGLKRGRSGAWEIQTTDPAFAGDGRAEVEVGADVSDPDDRPYDVTISAHFTELETPIVFEIADPHAAAAFKPGAKLSVDISAFGFAPDLFVDEAAYDKAQQKEKMPFAANYFVPSGMFFKSAGGMMPDGSTRPKAYADFAGTVLKAELRANALGGKFWSASVKTLGGAVFDVVMDPSSVKMDPKPGNIVSGRFWLSARLAP